MNEPHEIPGTDFSTYVSKWNCRNTPSPQLWNTTDYLLFF